MRFCAGLAQTSFFWVSIKIEMKMNQILLWSAPDTFLEIFYKNVNEQPARFCAGLLQTNFLNFFWRISWQSILLFCSELAQPKLLWFSIENWITNQADSSLGCPRPIHIVSYSTLYKNQQASALGWPRSSSSTFLLRFIWNSIRFWGAD